MGFVREEYDAVIFGICAWMVVVGGRGMFLTMAVVVFDTRVLCTDKVVLVQRVKRRGLLERRWFLIKQAFGLSG